MALVAVEGGVLHRESHLKRGNRIDTPPSNVPLSHPPLPGALCRLLVEALHQVGHSASFQHISIEYGRLRRKGGREEEAA